MKTVYEEPVVTRRGPDDETETHPAYAQISASRVQGRINLYGSDFEHHHYVIVRIAQSDTKRNLSHDWPHATPTPYIEVAMSEAQWAEFVSSMNVGDGPRCTLQYLHVRGNVPQIPAVRSRREQFVKEMSETVQDALAAAKLLLQQVRDEPGIKASTRKLMVDAAERMVRELEKNVPYVAQQFDGHVEATLNRARIEVNAYVETLLVRSGIRAAQLSAGAPPDDTPLRFIDGEVRDGGAKEG
jgi:hypothetical protein